MIATSRIFLLFFLPEKEEARKEEEITVPMSRQITRCCQLEWGAEKERKKKKKRKKRKENKRRRRRRKNLHFSAAPHPFLFFSAFFSFSFFFFFFFSSSPHRCQHALGARVREGNRSLLERRDHTNTQLVPRQNIFQGMAREGPLSPQHPYSTY